MNIITLNTIKLIYRRCGIRTLTHMWMRVISSRISRNPQQDWSLAGGSFSRVFSGICRYEVFMKFYSQVQEIFTLVNFVNRFLSLHFTSHYKKKFMLQDIHAAYLDTFDISCNLIRKDCCTNNGYFLTRRVPILSERYWRVDHKHF